MKLDDLQRDWDALGRIDPMWAVLTHDDKCGGGWREDEFFETGRREIAGVMAELEKLGRPAARGRCLDFGCGVGRLTQALAEHFERCDGVDIAPSMLEAARRLNRRGDRVAYHLNETDDLSRFEDAAFDFVYSNIVLQHVGPEAAKAYIREFVRLLAPGGVALFQVPSENIRAELRATYRLPDAAFRARIEADVPATFESRRRARVHARVTNESAVPWPHDPPTDGTCRIRLGNHWLRPDGRPEAFDDGRAELPRTVGPGENVEIALDVTPPARHGRFVLALDLVQEDVAWFEGKGSVPFHASVRVRGSLRGRLGDLLSSRRRVAVTDATDTALVLRAGGEAPVMRMTGVPRAEVLATVEAAGGRVVEVFDDPSSGREWRSYRYAVARAG